MLFSFLLRATECTYYDLYIPLSLDADVTSSQSSLPPGSQKHWTRIWILNAIRRSSRIDCWPLDDLSFALSWIILEKKDISFSSC